MQKRYFIISLLFFCFIANSQTTSAQTSAIPTPDFKYQVMLVKKDNTLTDLDKTLLQTKSSISRAGAMIPIVGGARALAGNKLYLKADGCCAKTSLSGKPTATFVIRVELGTDPETVVGLYQFEEKKDYRKLVTNKVTMGSALGNGNALGNSKLDGIQLHFKKVADGVYAINYPEQLADGEYVFLIINENLGGLQVNAANQENKKGYCFGVNNKE